MTRLQIQPPPGDTGGTPVVAVRSSHSCPTPSRRLAWPLLVRREPVAQGPSSWSRMHKMMERGCTKPPNLET
ncbi:hypothetical protein V2G26_005421 [Clonostachys chloroleuca]